LQNDSRFDSDDKRERNNELLISILNEVFAGKSLREWIGILDGHGLVSSMAQTISEITNDPQAAENGFFAKLDHPNAGEIRLVASPVKFQRDGSEREGAGPGGRPAHGRDSVGGRLHLG